MPESTKDLASTITATVAGLPLLYEAVSRDCQLFQVGLDQAKVLDSLNLFTLTNTTPEQYDALLQEEGERVINQLLAYHDMADHLQEQCSRLAVSLYEAKLAAIQFAGATCEKWIALQREKDLYERR